MYFLLIFNFLFLFIKFLFIYFLITIIFLILFFFIAFLFVVSIKNILNIGIFFYCFNIKLNSFGFYFLLFSIAGPYFFIFIVKFYIIFY